MSKKNIIEAGDGLSVKKVIELKGMSLPELKIEAETRLKSLLPEKIQHSWNLGTEALTVLDEKMEENVNSEGSKKHSFKGVATFSPREKVDGITLSMTIPFVVKNNVLEHPETIRFLGKELIFNEKNLNRVLKAAEEVIRNPNVLDEDSSFEEVVDLTNNTTDVGNLRRVLDIRNQESAKGNMYAFASEVFDALEKVSSIKRLSPADLNVIKAEATKIAAESERQELEKIASSVPGLVEESLKSSQVFKTLKAMKWENVGKVKDRTKVQIIDKTADGNDIELKPAVVFRNIFAPDGKPVSALVVDKDKNYKVIRTKEDETYKVSTSDDVVDIKLAGKKLLDVVKTLQKEKTGILIKGDEVYGPVTLVKKDLTAALPMATLKGDAYAGFKTLVPHESFKDVHTPSPEEVTSFFENNVRTQDEVPWAFETFVFMPADIAFVELGGFINTPIHSIKDIIFDGSDEPLAKIAFSDGVMIKKPVPDMDSYQVMFRSGNDKRSLRDLTKTELFEACLVVGVPKPEIVAMVSYLDSGEKEVDRRLSVDLSRLDGAGIKAKSNSLFARFKDAFFEPTDARKVMEDVLMGAGSEVTADILQDSPRLFEATGVFSDLVSKMADAGHLADRFEKLALDTRSKDIQTVAGLMALTHHMDQSLVKISKEAGLYDLSEVKTALRDLKPAIEKCAALLVELRDDQEVTGDEVVGRNTVHKALLTLDRLNEYAGLK